MITINQVVALRDPLNKQKYNKTLRAIAREYHGLKSEHESVAIIKEYRKNMMPLAVDDLELETGIRLSAPVSMVGTVAGVEVITEAFLTDRKQPVLLMCRFCDREESNFSFSSSESSRNHEITKAFSELVASVGHESFIVYQWSPMHSLFEEIKTQRLQPGVDVSELIEKAFGDEKHKKDLEKRVTNDELVGRYLSAKGKMDSAKEELEAIKKEMIVIADGCQTVFSDEVTCTPVVREGAIDFKKMANDHVSDEVNREDYRKKMKISKYFI